MEGENIAREIVNHKERKGSALKWFVIGIIPIANFYFLWKAAESISGHEKAIKKYEFLDHMKTKGSTTELFLLFLVPVIIGFFAVPLIYLLDVFGLALMVVLGLVAIGVELFILWKMAEVVSGHEKIYKERYEVLIHKERKESTVKWFAMGIIPIANLYLLWKVAETISGHEKIYVK